jgi:hypothetical protein
VLYLLECLGLSIWSRPWLLFSSQNQTVWVSSVQIEVSFEGLPILAGAALSLVVEVLRIPENFHPPLPPSVPRHSTSFDIAVQYQSFFGVTMPSPTPIDLW